MSLLEASAIEFVAFPKIPRLRRGVLITEKIDGTNACIIVTEDGQVAAQSRTRLITPEKGCDNAGFAQWVHHNEAELAVILGPGRHFGEWWGSGIQRGYGQGVKRLSLFNVSRWSDLDINVGGIPVNAVPVVGSGPMSDETINWALEKLRTEGSLAAPGFMKPEGIVVRHMQSGGLFKVLLENDEIPKGQAAE